jgi:hypothetical protein
MTETRVMVGARFLLVLLTMAATTGAAILGALFAPGWLVPTLVNLAVNGAFLVFIVVRKDGILGRLFLMGSVAAVVELLISDPAFVTRHVLVYEPGGPFVVDSPLYMPLSWIFLIVQIGAISRWAVERWGLARAMVLMAVLGGVNGPMYEFLAQYSKLWYYQNCWMVRGVPIFVIASELMIGAAVPLAVRRLPRLTLQTSAVVGLLLGVWTWVTGLVTFALVGFPPGA